MNDRFYMKMNGFKNLVGFEKSEEGQYFFAWQKDVETIEEAYDFLDIWIEDLDLPIQEKLISCWDQAYRCIGWATAAEDLLISPELNIKFYISISDPMSGIIHCSMEAKVKTGK